MKVRAGCKAQVDHWRIDQPIATLPKHVKGFEATEFHGSRYYEMDDAERISSATHRDQFGR